MIFRKQMTAQTTLRLGLGCYAIAGLTRVVAHPTTDFSRGFVEGFSGILLGAGIVFLIAYMIKYRRTQSTSGPCS